MTKENSSGKKRKSKKQNPDVDKNTPKRRREYLKPEIPEEPVVKETKKFDETVLKPFVKMIRNEAFKTKKLYVCECTSNDKKCDDCSSFNKQLGQYLLELP